MIGGRSRKESLRLLDAAYDVGVRYFDVARVYGTGDAESVLGSFAASRRDSVTIATKFGIDPLRPTPSVVAAKRIVRPVARRSRRLVHLLRRHSDRSITRGQFSPEHARASLAVSLAQLQTRFVDVFLLHDCSAGDWARRDLRQTLEELATEGVIRAFGTATSFKETRAILSGGNRGGVVAQFDSDVLSRNVDNVLGAYDVGRVVTYGCLSRVVPLLRTEVVGNPGRAAEWTAGLDIDAGSIEELASLALAHAAAANPGGIVLFSSGSAGRIARNVRALFEARYTADQIDEFARRMRSLV